MSTMARLVVVLVIAIVVGISRSNAGDPQSLTEADHARLKKITELQTPLESNPISNIFYHVNLHSQLDKKISEPAAICDHVKKVPPETLETIYYVTSIAKMLPNCALDGNKLLAAVRPMIKDDSTVLELYRAGLSFSNLQKPLDAKLPKLLVEALKREDTLLNIGLAFQLAAKFAKSQEQSVFVEKIPDVVVQADEVNGKYLQFEGGLGVSAAVIRGIYQLSTAANKPIGITNDQALKFVNYFLSRKYVLTPKGASEVIDILALYTNNKFHIPYMITKYGSSALSMENPVLTLKVTNVLGESVTPITVTGSTLEPVGQKNPAMKNIAFKPVQGDSTLFAYDFFEKPLPSGFYTLTVDALPQKNDPRVLGNTGVQIRISILTEIKIDNAEITITDVDAGSQSFKLTYPASLQQLPEMDYLQRFLMKFQVKDLKNGNLVDVHQAFVRFHHLATKQEIVFISEIDSNGFHKVDLNNINAKDFNDLSGPYEIELYIGDPLIMKALNWKIGTINIQFPSSGQAVKQSSPLAAEYGPKPEITHIFREQDKRPPAIVSNFFTFLVMVPLLALFVMWYKIGVNLSNFKLSLSALLFHGSLAAIFLLYGCFFVKLDMFQTVKYLAGLSAMAYLSGHSLLSNLIRKKCLK